LLLSGRRVVNPGAAAFGYHPPMRVLPGRQGIRVLCPACHRCLIAPVQQLRHHASVRVGAPKLLHRVLGIPRRSGPEDVSRLAHRLHGAVAWCAPRLHIAPHRIPNESREKEPRAKPQACDRHQGHARILPTNGSLHDSRPPVTSTSRNLVS